MGAKIPGSWTLPIFYFRQLIANLMPIAIRIWAAQKIHSVLYWRTKVTFEKAILRWNMISIAQRFTGRTKSPNARRNYFSVQFRCILVVLIIMSQRHQSVRCEPHLCIQRIGYCADHLGWYLIGKKIVGLKIFRLIFSRSKI